MAKDLICGISLQHSARPAAPEKTVYTCPMHPEIRQHQPGACPKCGMDLVAERIQSADEEGDPELSAMTRRFWISVVLGLPVLLLAMLPMLGLPVERWIGHRLSLWVQFALATPVVFWCGWPLLERGVRSVLTWNLNMFTLIALGTATAYFYSVVVVLFPAIVPEAFRQHGQAEVYFESATVITVLVLLGQVLEPPHIAARAVLCGNCFPWRRQLRVLSPADRSESCRLPKCIRAICSAWFRATRFPSTEWLSRAAAASMKR